MIELGPDQFGRVAHLFGDLTHHLAAAAILKGIVRGRVFADDVRTPSAAMVWDCKAVFFLAGSPSGDEFRQGLRALMDDQLTPQLASGGLRRWIRATCAAAWQPYLPGISGVQSVRPLSRQYFEYRVPAPPISGPLPNGARIEAVDSSLLERTQLANAADLRNEIAGTWGAIEAFVRHGFGYCVVEDDRLVSWCLSEYNVNGRCEFGVETAPDRQRRGLAGQATAAGIAHALAQGIRPGWHSWRSNTPSVTLATSCGFELVADYVVYVTDQE